MSKLSLSNFYHFECHEFEQKHLTDLMEICDIKCSKLGMFSFDMSLTYCDNSTKVNKWSHFDNYSLICSINVFYFKHSSAVSISGGWENNKIGASRGA